MSLEYFERGAVTNGNRYFGQGIAPHGQTQRWSYTVPTGKYAKILYLFAFLLRATAAVAAVRAQIEVYVTNGSGNTDLSFPAIITNNIGDSHLQSQGESGVLQAGESITAYTADTSNGGTMDYSIALAVSEFS